MNKVKDSSSVDPNHIYPNPYLIDTESGYNNNHDVGFVNEFKVETSVGGSQSAPTSLVTTSGEHFTYPHYTPNMDFIPFLQTADDSFGSSSSSGAKMSYPPNRDHIQSSSYFQSSGLSIDSFFSLSDVKIKPDEIDENDNSLKDSSSKRGKFRGRGRSTSCARKRQLNQENKDDCNSNSSLIKNGSTGRGKQGKVLTRHPFIPSYMDPNNGPHLCVVCRHNASGFHYRVMACEGCKGFFRRTVQNNLVYACKFNNKCEIQPHNRAQCQQCRWKKCLDVGMAKDLVLSDEARKAKKELIAANRAKKLTSDRLSSKSSNEYRDPTSPVNNNDGVIFKLSDEDERFINQIKLAFDETEVTNTKITVDFQDPNISQVLQCIIDHHVATLIMRRDIVEDGNIHSSKFNFSQQFNTLKTIVKPILQRIVTFAFMLPRFNELTLNDQLILLKNACFEIVTLRNTINYDPQSQSLTLEPDFVVTKDLTKVHELVEPTYVFVSRISSLNLDYVETSLMASLALLSTDRMGLNDMDKVENIQDDILQCIDNYMKQSIVDNSYRQSEVFATVLPELRSTTGWHTQIINKSIAESSINNLLPILKAIYHYPIVNVCPTPQHFIESSNSRFIQLASHQSISKIPNTSNSNAPNNNNNNCHQIYNSDIKYVNFPYIDQTMSSLYSGLNNDVQSTTLGNVYSGSHLPSHSGQLTQRHHHRQQQQQQQQQLLSSTSSSFTELLIDSSSDITIHRLLKTDKYIHTQESTSSSSLLSTHANFLPVTNQNQATINEPVYDFANDL